MYRDTRPRSDNYDRYDIEDYVAIFIIELEQLEKAPVRLRSPGEASRVKELLNAPESSLFKSIPDLRSGVPYWNEQQVDCLPSNLGKNRGYIFYFICNGCGKRTRYLYSSSAMYGPKCRQCCRLPYKQQNRQTRSLSRLIHKDYLPSEAKFMLLKRLKITKSEVLDYLSELDK